MSLLAWKKKAQQHDSPPLIILLWILKLFYKSLNDVLFSYSCGIEKLWEYISKHALFFNWIQQQTYLHCDFVLLCFQSFLDDFFSSALDDFFSSTLGLSVRTTSLMGPWYFSWVVSKYFCGFSNTSKKAWVIALDLPPSKNRWSRVNVTYMIGAMTT